MNRFVRCFTKITAVIYEWIILRRKVIYENKKIQKRSLKGGYILCSNHTSIIDFIPYFFTFYFSTFYTFVSEVLYNKNTILKWFISCLGCIMVDRNNFDFTFIEKGLNILNKKKSILFFPEARIPLKEERNDLLEFKPSIILLALKSNKPIIPLYTNGKYFNKHRTKVVIGTPFYANKFYDEKLSEKDNINNITLKLRERVQELGKLIK